MPIPNKTLYLYHLPTTLDFFEKYFLQPNKVSEQLNEKVRRITSDDLSYRIINYWENEGLLSVDRPNGKGWRRYSFIDIVWMQLLSELRKFGFPIEKLKVLKEHLSSPHPFTKEKSFVHLEAYLAMAILQKVPCSINILLNGEALCTSQEEKNNLDANHFFYDNPSINISLNALLSKVTKKDFRPINTSEVIYNDEYELISFLRLSDYNSVTVYFKNNVIERFEGTELIKTTARLDEVLKDAKYQKIEVLQANNKVVQFKRTISKKIK